MIQRIWQGKSKLYYLLIPFSWCYRFVVIWRNYAYRVGYLTSWKASVPVVVVGNLTVGGNGKTPLVIWLIKQLTERGLKVGVVSRGYKGTSQTYPVIVNDQSIAKIVGDEPVLIYQATRVPLAVSPRRVEACQCLLANYSLDIIITDDGLQHYALQRDYEIVVVDYRRQFGNGYLLPAGPLREDLNRLNRVDCIVYNGGEVTNAYSMQLQADKIINLKTKQHKALTDLTSCYAMAGIGDPERFFNTLKEHHLRLLKSVAFPDHYFYSSEELHKTFSKRDYPVIMTEKDAVKCYAFSDENWWYLPVTAIFDEQQRENLLSDMINKLALTTIKEDL